MSILKEIQNALKEFKKDTIYLISKPFQLEESATVCIKSIPLKFEDVIWKHYYYVYRFKNLFTQELFSVKESALTKINELNTEEYEEGKIIFDNSFKYTVIHSFFKAENKESFEKNGLRFIMQTKVNGIQSVLSLSTNLLKRI